MDGLLVGYYGSYGDTLVAMETMAIMQILKIPQQPRRYFGFHSQHWNTLVSVVTMETTKII